VLWDLGSLEKRKEFADFKSETTGKTTLQGDSILRLVANEKASFIEVEDDLTDLKSQYNQDLDTRIWTQFIIKTADGASDSTVSSSGRKNKSQSVII
jgi:hypothetical protein